MSKVTPKPIAYVSTYRSARGASVSITAPDGDHQKAATAAALAASSWATETARGVTISKPIGARVGGACEVEQVGYHMADARDAAKASLRTAGYTVRAS